jgi:hypothetical protein
MNVRNLFFLPCCKGVIVSEAEKAAGDYIFGGADHEILPNGLQTLKHDDVEVGVEAAKFGQQQHPEHVARVLHRILSCRDLRREVFEAGRRHCRRPIQSGHSDVGPAPHHGRQRRFFFHPQMCLGRHEHHDHPHGGVVHARRLNRARLTRAQLRFAARHQEEHYRL